MKNKAALLLFLVFILSFIISQKLDSELAACLTKPLPVLVLMFFCLFSFSSKYNYLVAAALFFSALGDIFLSEYIGNFIAGLLAFLIAHVFYLGAFVTKKQTASYATAFITYAIGAAVFLFLYPNLGKMRLPVLFYNFVIMSMIWRVYAQRSATSNSKWAVIGATVFVVSDFLIAFSRFVEPFQHSSTVIMATYWFAQYFIFLSKDQDAPLKQNH